jgi:microcompartment protein CcmK/EutM
VPVSASGCSRRRQLGPPDGGDQDQPVDAVIMAIVDTWSVGDETVYTKD